MNNNKLLVVVSVPLLEEEYDIYIPINKKIGTIKNIIIEQIASITEVDISLLKQLSLYDKYTTNILHNDMLVKQSEISNGSKILLM